MTLVQRSALHTVTRQAACLDLLQRCAGDSRPLRQLRIAWADLQGYWRGKTLVCGGDLPAQQVMQAALDKGIGMVSTVMLKDSADRTAFQVFEPGALAALPGFGPANNVLLLPDPSSFQRLPWAPNTGWLRADPVWPDGSAVAVDPRRVLKDAVAALAAFGSGGQRGLQLRCGLELEFHIYRLDPNAAPLAPDSAAWPAPAPTVQLLHNGYALLSEAHGDQAAEALDIVQDTAQGLGLPLRSLEVELGPSQFEAVFAPTDALTAADHVVLFRNGVRQALLRAGYWATFCCKPPFAHAVASGWHLHQSLCDARGTPVMARTGASTHAANDARRVLSDKGALWLGGLLAHANAMLALCAPSLPAYARYRGSVMAPQSAVWARDNRGAMLRVVGETTEPGSVRIENRAGEPMANPYLYIAAQILAGLDGLRQQRQPPPASEHPYATGLQPLADNLPEALRALADDTVMQAGLGAPMMAVYQAVRRQELARHAKAEDQAEWLRREYFGRG